MSRLLTACLVTSFTAHAVILLPWAVRSPTLALTSTETAPILLNVTLNDNNNQDHATGKQPGQQSQPPRRRFVTQHLTQLHTDVTPHESTRLQQATPTVVANASLQDNIIRSKVMSHVQTDFSEHFYYPMLARRKGWQGNVLIGFWVEANGAISNARITQGSGYPLLDESALTALQKLQRVPHATEWLNGTRIELSLPVLFRLQGS